MRQAGCVGRLLYESCFYSVIKIISMDARLCREHVKMVTWMLLNI